MVFVFMFPDSALLALSANQEFFLKGAGSLFFMQVDAQPELSEEQTRTTVYFTVTVTSW
jgi:hypothetical protein